MDHNPSPEGKSNILSTSQEIPYIFWNVNVRHRFHNNPLLPVRSQINLAHTLSSCIRFNIFFPSAATFLKWSLFFRLPHHILICISFLLHVWHILCSSHDEVMGLASSTWPKPENECGRLIQNDDGIMMDVCFENSYGAPRENSNMLQGSYLRGQTPRKDCDYVLLSYLVKWGYVSKFSKFWIRGLIVGQSSSGLTAKQVILLSRCSSVVIRWFQRPVMCLSRLESTGLLYSYATCLLVSHLLAYILC